MQDRLHSANNLRDIEDESCLGDLVLNGYLTLAQRSMNAVVVKKHIGTILPRGVHS